MTLETPGPAKRYGHKIQLIRERIILYLRLLRLPEDTVSSLTEETMHRFSVSSPDNKNNSVLSALHVLLEILKKNSIQPDERYHLIFTDAYRPHPMRTPMAYSEFDPKNAVHQNKKRTLILRLRRTFFLMLVLASTVSGTWAITTILGSQGLSMLRYLIIVVFSFLFGWISINFWSVLLGFFISMKKEDKFCGFRKN
jgi:membrane glycosyltransferase